MERNIGLVAGQVLRYLDENRAPSMTHLSADIRCPLQRLKAAVSVLSHGGLVRVFEQNQEEIISRTIPT